MPTEGEGEGKDFGKFCIFLSRSCGIFSSIIVLLCGFVTLVPLPSTLVGNYGQCTAVGLIMIVSAVVMFFLEGSVLGYCVGRLSFLQTISKYMKNWMRAALYMALGLLPFAIACISASTILGLGTMFLMGAINFVLAIGAKGEHSAESYSRVRLSEVTPAEEEEDTTATDETKLKQSDV